MLTICLLLIFRVGNRKFLFCRTSIEASLGVIQAVRDGGKDEDVQEVKDLVTSFIKKPSCLILLVVSCESKSSSA